MLTKAIRIFGFMLVFAFLLVGTLWTWRILHRAMTPAPKVARDVTFVIHEGESANDIAAGLKEAGLIKYTLPFRALTLVRGAESKLQAGEFQLRTDMSMSDIIKRLSESKQFASSLIFTEPEGWRWEQTADSLGGRGLISRDDFALLVHSREFPYDFLKDVPQNGSLEGFLFPDTYKVPVNFKTADYINLMLKNFDKKFTPEMRAQAEKANLSIYQVVTLASIIEREAMVDEERPIIASVYLNRLKAEMPLQADPTVQYLIGQQKTGETWWKRRLTGSDLEVDNPYNTYLYKGLPPGPICSPGLASIQAVLNPATTDYLFFVATGEGTHAFASTLPEHEVNVAKYRAKMREIEATIAAQESATAEADKKKGVEPTPGPETELGPNGEIIVSTPEPTRGPTPASQAGD